MGNTLGLAPMGTLPRRGPRREEPLPSPGSFDELHRLCKDVFPAQMEGVKLVVNKVLSSHFQVSHTVHMSALGLPGYHLHAAYAGDWQLSPTEVFPTVVGDMDSSGSLNAQVLLLLAERLRAKAVFQTQQAKFLTWQFDGEYRGDDYTATLTLGNPDLIGESVIMVAHFLQSITHRLVLGGELVYHRRPGEEGTILTLAGKYSGTYRNKQNGGEEARLGAFWGGFLACIYRSNHLLPLYFLPPTPPAVHWVATLNVGSGGAHASYYHKANEQVQVGVEFEANTRLQDTTFSFGYHLTLPQADMVFRGLVDSNWCVGAVLEKKMRPLPVTLALGAFLNHWRNRFHCGFSITVG
ncbi:mitochondrial import receptor subunit TOM40B isoform X1 [Psammomys obesus]|uniref:mitochondrial import receptor subunit TOM40B isoform X1 n=1 Tax=Psammomys obesus TaxID=48139 RepID=UPI00245305B9|nr:mitochondrial import receptor subunit TOM40B isoform X1 [Psammomys obesus]